MSDLITALAALREMHALLFSADKANLWDKRDKQRRQKKKIEDKLKAELLRFWAAQSARIISESK